MKKNMNELLKLRAEYVAIQEKLKSLSGEDAALVTNGSSLLTTAAFGQKKTAPASNALFFWDDDRDMPTEPEEPTFLVC